MNRQENLFDQLFVLDMANNHQGSLEHGMKIVEGMGQAVRKHQAKAALKFQFRNLDSLIHPDYRERKDVKHIPRFLETAIAPEDYQTLADAIRKNGMLTMATPFDEPSVELLLKLDIDILKIASCSATDWPLLEEAAKANKPILLSTGGLTIHEIDRVVAFLTHKNFTFALMHCVSIYPTPNHLANMTFLEKMVRRYRGIPVGYSGHEAPENRDIAKVAVAMGAKMLERHVGFETDDIKLNKYSMTPEEVDQWIEAAQIAKTIIGEGDDKEVEEEEKASLLSLQRGVFAKAGLKKGEKLSADKVFFAMPCRKGQLTSGAFGRYRTAYFASKDYEADEPIFEQEQFDETSRIYGIIHDVKGMLHEARIVLGEDDEIELSHHYGIESFRETGALIVNVINREYCKKYVILLPGQKHPNHRHHIKEETFFLLWGDLQLELDGEVRTMKPGEKALIERKSWHRFSSAGGCIIEEVSTTHQIGDSEYEDASISELDIKKRKTIIERW